MAMQSMGDGPSDSEHGKGGGGDVRGEHIRAGGRRGGTSSSRDVSRRSSAFFARHVGWSPNPLSRRSEALQPRTRDAQVSISVCPFCAVGCSQQVFVKDGRIIDVEGNPASPINDGRLCPKGASTYQLIHNPDRPTTILYRAPKSDHWEERPLDWAMERIARLVKQTRDADFRLSNPDGVRINRLESIAHVGGATLDNEENYLLLKLYRNLGIVHITNQARI